VSRRFNYRRVKIHRNYTITEAATLLGAHKHTVSRWIAAGLPTTDDKRPLLIHGGDLRAFMKVRASHKQTCRPGEFYCLRCRAPRRPAGEMVDYIPKTASRGLLRGICPTCETLIYRATTLRAIVQNGDGLDVALQLAEQRLGDPFSPFSNVDFRQDTKA
jgi:excisionase family DNA binding protein